MNREVDFKRALAEARVAIGERLRRVRERLGESQPRFAERMGVAKLAVLTYEAGGSSPRADQLHMLAAAGVDVSFIVTGIPSLDSPEACQQFASALAWVKHECAVSALAFSDAEIIGAAWSAFKKSSQQTGDTEAPDETGIREIVKASVARVAPLSDRR